MAEKKEASPKVYLLVFAALMVLLGATIGAAYLPLGAAGIPVALGIAGLKALLVIMFFMHVKYRSGLVWIFALGGFYWFAVLLVHTMADYATRETWERGVIDPRIQLEQRGGEEIED